MRKFRLTHSRLILLLHKTAVTAETHRCLVAFFGPVVDGLVQFGFFVSRHNRSRIQTDPLASRYCPRQPRSCFRLVALSEGGFSDVRHLHPFRIRRSVGFVVVVPVPPLVSRSLWIAFRRVLPLFLATERR